MSASTKIYQDFLQNAQLPQPIQNFRYKGVSIIVSHNDPIDPPSTLTL